MNRSTERNSFPPKSFPHPRTTLHYRSRVKLRTSPISHIAKIQGKLSPLAAALFLFCHFRPTLPFLLVVHFLPNGLQCPSSPVHRRSDKFHKRHGEVRCLAENTSNPRRINHGPTMASNNASKTRFVEPGDRGQHENRDSAHHKHRDPLPGRLARRPGTCAVRKRGASRRKN